MQIQITDQQKQQIMQTQEFVVKLSELMKGYCPTIPSELGDFATALDAVWDAMPYSAAKLQPNDYEILINSQTDKWDGIMWQKYCIQMQSSNRLQLGIDRTTYYDYMRTCDGILKQIDKELEKQKKKAIEAVFLAHKAKNSIIHS